MHNDSGGMVAFATGGRRHATSRLHARTVVAPCDVVNQPVTLEALLKELPWLHFTYFTSQGHDFVNHHYGFHVLLSPCVQLSHALTGDYLSGARWAMAVFFTTKAPRP